MIYKQVRFLHLESKEKNINAAREFFMAYDSLSLSQPLRGGGYNEYLLGKMQNKNGLQSAVSQAEQTVSRQTLLDSVSGFASELRSQNLVRAMAAVQEKQNSLPPTLAEQGAHIDQNGTVTIPNSSAPMPASETSPVSPAVSPVSEKTANAMQITADRAFALSPKTSMALQGMKAIALDSKSLGILSRISARRENPSLQAERRNPLQQKFDELSEKFSLGSLSKKYESGSTGSQSIGYDRVGGTSYGTYQLSSRAGTFGRFLEFLENKEPQWAKTLKNAGSADTGSRNGAVPSAWKDICAQNPERMKELEHDFIVQSHYEPVFRYVQEKWQGAISPALKEVIFSTSVQHGVNGAKHIIDQSLAAMRTPPADNDSADAANKLYMEGFEQAKPRRKQANSREHEAEFIKNIYENRKDKFTSSAPAVQQAARNRFVSEQKEALALLG